MTTGLLTVLGNPSKTATEIRFGRIHITSLVLAVLGIDFLLTLLLLPLARTDVNLAMQKHPEISTSMSWVILGVSVIFGTMINMVLALIVAMIVYLATALAKTHQANYRNIFEAVLLGSSPLIVGRCIRTIAHALQWKPAESLTIAGFVAAVHVPVPPWLQPVSISPFDLWSLLLFAYLYANISGLRRASAYSIVGALWCLLQVVSFRMLGK